MKMRGLIPFTTLLLVAATVDLRANRLRNGAQDAAAAGWTTKTFKDFLTELEKTVVECKDTAGVVAKRKLVNKGKGCAESFHCQAFLEVLKQDFVVENPDEKFNVATDKTDTMVIPDSVLTDVGCGDANTKDNCITIIKAFRKVYTSKDMYKADIKAFISESSIKVEANTILTDTKGPAYTLGKTYIKDSKGSLCQ